MLFRSAINNELTDLEKVLEDSVELLNSGGRIAVISFHSLEDRMVKRFIRRQEQGKQLPIGLPVTEDMLDRKMKKLGKAVMPTRDEVSINARARSAVLRAAERL